MIILHRTSRNKRLLCSIRRITTTFGNLDFETIPDGSWVLGGNRCPSGPGLKQGFENFSIYPNGAIIPFPGANKTFTAFGTVNVIANFDNHLKVCSIENDGLGGDDVASTSLEWNPGVGAGILPIPPGNIGIYEFYFASSDVTQQSLIVPGGAASYYVFGIVGSSWVAMNGAGVLINCVDLPPPINNIFYHVKIYVDFITANATIYVNGFPSAFLGVVQGMSPPPDISGIAFATGINAIGLPAPAAVYNVYVDAVDHNGVPDYVEGRNMNDIGTLHGVYGIQFHFSNGSIANAVQWTCSQSNQVTIPAFPDILHISVNMWMNPFTVNSPVDAGAQMIVNNTFDVNINGWNSGIFPDYTCVLSQDLVTPRTGPGCLQLAGPYTALKGSATNDAIAVDAGRAYRFRYYAMQTVNTGSIRAAFDFYDAGGIKVGSTVFGQNHPLAGAYIGHQDDFIAPNTATTVRIHLLLLAANVATVVVVDDVSLFRIDIPHIEVTDVASGNTYYATPVFDSMGYGTAKVNVPTTGNWITITLAGTCEFGWGILDNVRIG